MLLLLIESCDLLFLPFLDRCLEFLTQLLHLSLSFIRLLVGSWATWFHLKVRFQTGELLAARVIVLHLLDAGHNRCCNRIGLLTQQIVRL